MLYPFLYFNHLVVSSVIVQDASCGPYYISASSSGYVITGEDYIARLGEQWECSWVIETSGDGTGLKLTVESLHLAGVSKTNV